ncbi:MAG: HAD family hydrolase [Deltaproteobacteria bacterium]|nr:HAD family hydrolase [Deltaproteobacteria bacterium]
MTRENVIQFIQKFDMLLFDMGDTFMFNCDRFSSSEDYLAMYQSLGGTKLSQSELSGAIRHIEESLLKVARDERRYDSFPRLRDFIESDSFFKDFSGREKKLVEDLFSRQECGEIPQSLIRVLKQLAANFKLGLISNVWADKTIFEEKLKEAGLNNLFDPMLFSSEYGSIKPAARLFEIAAEFTGIPCPELVYIGNSYKRDIIGAKARGMSAILVNNGLASEITGETQPNFVIAGIEKLIERNL